MTIEAFFVVFAFQLAISGGNGLFLDGEITATTLEVIRTVVEYVSDIPLEDTCSSSIVRKGSFLHQPVSIYHPRSSFRSVHRSLFSWFFDRSLAIGPSQSVRVWAT